MLVSILVYAGLTCSRRRKNNETWSLKFITDNNHPTMIGMVLVGLGASAILSGAFSVTACVRHAMLDKATRDATPAPELPVDMLLIGFAVILWVSFEAIMKATFSSKDEEKTVENSPVNEGTISADNDSVVRRTLPGAQILNWTGQEEANGMPEHKPVPKPAATDAGTTRAQTHPASQAPPPPMAGGKGPANNGQPQPSKKKRRGNKWRGQ
jgi:hypothetical protein